MISMGYIFCGYLCFFYVTQIEAFSESLPSPLNFLYQNIVAEESSRTKQSVQLIHFKSDLCPTQEKSI